MLVTTSRWVSNSPSAATAFRPGNERTGFSKINMGSSMLVTTSRWVSNSPSLALETAFRPGNGRRGISVGGNYNFLCQWVHGLAVLTNKKPENSNPKIQKTSLNVLFVLV
jgi:hypothetical protein